MSNYTLTATFNYSRQPPNLQRLVLVTIADAANQHTDLSRCDVRKLAHLCNCKTVRPIQKAILKVIQTGELIGILNPRLGGGGWYEFFIPIFPGEEGYDPQPCEATDHYCNGYHTPCDVLREGLYMHRAQQARAADNKPRGKRRRPSIRRVDKLGSYPQGASSETQAPASSETDGASSETDGASSETDGASEKTIPPHPSIGIPISNPVITQVDPGAISPEKKLTRAEWDRRFAERELAKDAAWRKRVAR